MTIFSDNPYDRRMERLMTTVPNFKPRGVGFRFAEPQIFFAVTATPTEILAATMQQIHCPPFRKGDFIVMKTGMHPMRVHLKLFFKWGIEFDDEHPYTVPDQGNREVKYADRKEIQDGILEKYPPEWKEETPAPSEADDGGQTQQNSPKNEPQRTPPHGSRRNGSPPIRTSPPKKETAPGSTEAEIIKDLTETEVQSNEPS